MSHRHSALAIAAIVMGSALAGAVLRPVAAEAQVYDETGPRPFASPSHRNGDIDSGRGWADHRRGADELRQAYPRRSTGYDSRDRGPSVYGWRRPPHAYDERRWGRGDDLPDDGAHFDYGTSFADQPADVYPLDADPYEEVVAPVAPPVGAFQGPDFGCTVRRSQSITAAGWRKIVTYKTCYRR